MSSGFGGGFGQPSTTGFGQQATGGFGQAAQGGGTGVFGQTAAGGFGQAAAGGFGQPAQGAAAGGFGQAGAAGGFGQAAQGAATGGFGQVGANPGFGQAAAGGFGQQAASGFGQAAAGGFGQPAQGAAAGGFGQAGAAGGFGQAAQGATTGGFGSAAQGTTTTGFGQSAGGFGQQPSTGFGQAGTAGTFGQAAGRGAGGGFGQAGTTGGFGQAAQGATTTGFGQSAGGFGQQPSSGFGAAGRGTTNSFGQQPSTGFGQAGTAGTFGQAAGRGAGGGFGQAGTTGGFGQAAQGATTTGFGQSAGGFGQQPSTGFGQAGAAGTFGQAAGRGAGGGFGQAGTTGGFGQAAQGTTTTGFGQSAGGFGQQPSTGFGQAGAAGTFGQAAGRGAGGGFGQAGTTGGFGQAAQGATTTGFGQSAGGFGQQPSSGFGAAGRGTTNSFGQQPASGFAQGATNPVFGQAAGRGAGGGFGQAGTTGGFGQAAQGATTTGFGQSAGGFGQQPSSGFGAAGCGTANSFGQTTAGAGGFGQVGVNPGFGQTAAGGFGQQTAGGFNPAGRGTLGGFGQPAVAPSWGGGSAQTAQVDASLLNLPEFADKPYGNVLLFVPDKLQKKTMYVDPSQPSSTSTFNPPSVLRHQQRITASIPAPPVSTNAKRQLAPFSASALSSAELRELLNDSKVNLGVSDEGERVEPPRISHGPPGFEKPPSSEALTCAPVCSKDEYEVQPSLEVLRGYTARQLQEVYNFSVSRRDGKCSIEFLEPVNLVRCDIAEVVELCSNGEVKLYPGERSPPPLGHGVNVRARVSVCGIVNITARDLHIRCQKEGNKFESYNVETGVWVYLTNVGENEEKEYDDADREVDIVEGDADSRGAEQPSVVNNLTDARVTDVSQPERPEQLTRQGALSPALPPSLPQQHDPTLHPSEAPIPLSISRYVPQGDQTLMLPQRTQKVSVLRQTVCYPVLDRTARVTDFELPYTLPSAQGTPECERKGLFVVRSPHVKTRTSVYVVRREDSKMYEMNATLVSRSAMASLGRSFRCGWRTGGHLVAPTFAWVRDGTEGERLVHEVAGSRVSMSTIYFAHATSRHYLQSCAISVLRTICRYACRVGATSNKEVFFPLLEVKLCRGRGATSLSTEKLLDIMSAVSAVPLERISPVADLTARQTKTVITLLDALYGLPEADEADKNAVVERRYLAQLRRRNLNSWLKKELEFMDTWSNSDVDANPSQRLLRKLLCGKLREASSVARVLGSMELSRVVGICGEGNHFGGYVQTCDTNCLDEVLGIRERVISLISGVVEPFVSQPQYTWVEDGGERHPVAKVPLAATWKQLLGIFAFYGCTPDTPAEETISCFLERLRAPTSRYENSFPPYAENVSSDMLDTSRGRSFVSFGEQFPDAALSLLEGFAMGKAPSATALHPHSSSYCPTDYLTPFIIVMAVRALKLQRTDVYDDAETKSLLGFAATLECLDDAWFWALLPLHMIVDDQCRAVAVEQCLRRNAHRFREGETRTNADYVQLAELLKINERLLEVEVLLEKPSMEVVANAPSIRTHSSLQEALHRFSRGFTRR